MKCFKAVTSADGYVRLLYANECIAKFPSGTTLATVMQYISIYGYLAEFRRIANNLAVTTKESLSWDDSMCVHERTLEYALT